MVYWCVQDACSNPPDAEGVYLMIMKNFQRHYHSNRAPFGLFYHPAWSVAVGAQAAILDLTVQLAAMCGSGAVYSDKQQRCSHATQPAWQPPRI